MVSSIDAFDSKGGARDHRFSSDLALLCSPQYFNISVDTPGNDWTLMQHVMDGASAEVDEAAEERKGGAGNIGKMFASAGDKALIIQFHVPKALIVQLKEADKNYLELKDWVDAIVAAVGGTVEELGEEVAKVSAAADPEKDRFPLKLRDAAIAAGVNLLRTKGLIPDDDSDDDVNYAEAAGVEW